MQDGALSDDLDGQSISRATGKDSEHGIRGGSYKLKGVKNGMIITNNPELLSQPLGAECGNTPKGK